MARRLVVYVLPCQNTFSVHPRFLKPETKPQIAALFVSYIVRKWRFALSDVFAAQFASFGQKAYASNSKMGIHIHSLATRISTRNCTPEYFFKGIPKRTEHIEFVFPESVEKERVEFMLKKWITNHAPSYASGLFGSAMILPVGLYLAKFIGSGPANVLFSYNIFRVNAYWRAKEGVAQFQNLINSRKITWTKSSQLTLQIREIQKRIEDELEISNLDENDLDDYVVQELETELRAPELIRTHRRTRTHQIVYKNTS